MALRVWLPLTGSLENKGISDLQFSQSGTAITIDSAGKIGQCYNRATAKSAGRIESNNTILLDGDLSMCCWAKVTATVGDMANGLVTNHNAGSNANFSINVKQVSTDDYRISCSTGNGSGRTYRTYYGTTNIKNGWHHLALTYDNTTHIFQLWVDGIIEKTQSYTNSAVAGKIMLFDWNIAGTNNNYKPACMLNDVRIYDHCLSAAEVKEIAQGLVLHYKFDRSGISNFVTSNGAKTVTLGADATNAYTGYWYLDTYVKANNLLPANRKYIVEYDYNATVLTSTSAYLYSQINTARCAPNSSMTAIRTSTTGHVVEHFSMTSAQATYSSSFRFRLRFYGAGGDSVTISNLAIYIDTGEDIHTIQDSSGYGHHGTITGNVKITTASGRYSNCVYIPSGNTDYITTNNEISNFSSGITMNIWFKSSCTTPGSDYHEIFNIATATQNFETAIYKTGYFRGGMLINGARYVANTDNNNLVNGQWHMITMTYDGTALKRYVDGILKSTSTIAGTVTSTSCKFLWGHYGTNTSYYAKEAYLSDTRIYVTALSANDILELYHTAAKIDNLHNIHTFEYMENSTPIKLTKQGQFKEGEIEEDAVTKFYQTDQIIKAKNFIES